MVWEYDESDPWDVEPPDEDIPEEPEADEPLAVEVPEDIEACTEFEQIIIQEYQGGRISPQQYTTYMAKAQEMQQRHQEQQDEFGRRRYKDPVDAHLDALDLHRRRAAEIRAAEFELMGVDPAAAASEYDHLLENLDRPKYEQKRLRLSRMYRKLSPGQREEFRKKVLESGLMSEEMLDEMIEKELE